MNAQEAIERIEKRIVWLKNKLGRLNRIVTHSEEINEIKNEIEALSIVLESAKRLERISDEALSYSGIEDLDVNNVELFNFSKWVYHVSEGFEVSE